MPLLYKSYFINSKIDGAECLPSLLITSLPTKNIKNKFMVAPTIAKAITVCVNLRYNPPKIIAALLVANNTIS